MGVAFQAMKDASYTEKSAVTVEQPDEMTFKSKIVMIKGPSVTYNSYRKNVTPVKYRSVHKAEFLKVRT